MILCVTLAPAIDRVAHVAELRFDEVLRPDRVSVLPGGKGVNAARVVARLGGAVATTGFAGGHAGRWLVEALEREGLAPSFVAVTPETRTTVVTVDRSGRSTLLYEPAPALEPADLDRLLAHLAAALLPPATRAIVAGSVPPGLGDGAVRAIVETCRAGGRPVLVDVGGAPLREAAAASPDVAKVSLAEAHAAIGDVGDALGAARALVDAGAALAVVTDGARPAAAADRSGGAWWVEAPSVTVVNAVGSGDAFGAALSLALARGEPVERALARGAAAGGANAEALGAGMLDAARVQELEGQVQVRRA